MKKTFQTIKLVCFHPGRISGIGLLLITVAFVGFNGLSSFTEKLFAAGGRDLRVNKELETVGSLYSGSTVEFSITVKNASLGSGDAGSSIPVNDVLPSGLLFTGERSVFPDFSASLSDYDTQSNTIIWEIPIIFSDEEITITYSTLAIATGSMTNIVDVQTGNSLYPEDVPFTTTGGCEDGHNPINTGDYAVVDTNNVDCVTIMVTDEAIDGVCGSHDGQGFYAPAEPTGTGLCDAGIATVPLFTTGAGRTRSCIGINGGAVDSCGAVHLYCGDLSIDAAETCDDGNAESGDGCSAICEIENVRLLEVRPFAYSVTIKNFGSGTVDISNHRLSGYSGAITTIASISGSTVSGSLLLTSGASVTITGVDLFGGVGDIGLLYATGNDTLTASLIDYVQRGGSGNHLEGLAVEKGIRGTGEFLDENEPFTYTGDGSQTGIAYRSDVPSVCGNGLLQLGEACDDGNTDSGDGCSSTCAVVENGRTCNTPGAPCVDDDECSLGTDNCAADATCSNTPGSFTCTCNNGFTGNGVTCVDVNECVLSTHNCDSNAICTNTAGSFTCDCNSGFSGDGVTCTDDNECALGTDNCDTNAVCNNTPGSFSCSCGSGFTGDGLTCTDIDECSLGAHNCSPDAACSNTSGSFSCSCNAGFSGDGVTCSDVDECTLGTDTCDENAACTNLPGSFGCACLAGFTGDGQTCTDNDECTLGTDNCDSNATCSNTPGSFTCSCNSGFTGNGVTCVDADECTLGTDNCSANAACTNLPGSFSCACNSGFTGDGVTCTDNNECTLGTDNCDTNAVCTNIPGSFSCACSSGFTGNGVTCTDLDECGLGLDTCSIHASCTNLTGSFSCTCGTGFTGDGMTCTGICGDGSVVAGEACDDMNSSNTDACLTTCQAASCGDSYVQDGVEECDDGNSNNRDGCLNTCEIGSLSPYGGGASSSVSASDLLTSSVITPSRNTTSSDHGVTENGDDTEDADDELAQILDGLLEEELKQKNVKKTTTHSVTPAPRRQGTIVNALEYWLDLIRKQSEHGTAPLGSRIPEPTTQSPFWEVTVSPKDALRKTLTEYLKNK